MSDDLEPVPCAACGIVFGLPANYLAFRRKDRRQFWCPNGHSLTFLRPQQQQTVDSPWQPQRETVEWPKIEKPAESEDDGKVVQFRKPGI